MGELAKTKAKRGKKRYTAIAEYHVWLAKQWMYEVRACRQKVTDIQLAMNELAEECERIVTEQADECDELLDELRAECTRLADDLEEWKQAALSPAFS